MRRCYYVVVMLAFESQLADALTHRDVEILSRATQMVLG